MITKEKHHTSGKSFAEGKSFAIMERLVDNSKN